MKQRKLAALLIAALLCLNICLSLSYVYLECDHACEGEHCQTCEAIASCIKTLGLMAMLVLCHFSALRGQKPRFTSSEQLVYTVKAQTLVALKVKLTD